MANLPLSAGEERFIEHGPAEMYNKTRNAFEVYLELADEAGEQVQDREAIQQFLSG